MPCARLCNARTHPGSIGVSPIDGVDAERRVDAVAARVCGGAGRNVGYAGGSAVVWVVVDVGYLHMIVMRVAPEDAADGGLVAARTSPSQVSKQRRLPPRTG